MNVHLVDDLYGKIEHVLVYCEHPADVLFAEGLAKAFDEDVTISVAYPEIKKYTTGIFDHLQKISNEHENVIPFEIEEEEYHWVQDSLHSFDNNTLMPLMWESSLAEFDNDYEGELFARGKSILKSPHWKEFGFKVVPNTNTFPVAGGQIMRCGDKIYLDGDVWLEFKENIRQYCSELSDDTRVRDLFFKKIAYLTEGAVPEIVGYSNGKKSNFHIDVYYHPHSGGNFISVSKKGFCSGEEILGAYKNAEEMLGQFNEQECGNNCTVIPIVLPRVYAPWDLEVEISLDAYAPNSTYYIRSGHKIPFYSPLNAQYEIFRQDGEIVKRAYVPSYPFLHEPLFNEAYREAKAAFESRGFEVIEVPFYLIDRWGGLRCATKVLERTGTKEAIISCSNT